MRRPRWLRRGLYELERVWARGPMIQICLLLLLLCCLALAGGCLIHLIYPIQGDLGQSIWWAFLHLTDTGYMGGDKDSFERIVSIVLTLTGALLFVGGVVAILTNWLDRQMARLAAGLTPVAEEGHLLLLGSNPGISDLISECISAALQRWPHGPLPNVVVLCEEPVELNVPAPLCKKVRLVSRTGSTSQIEHLERADFTRARTILVLSSRGQRGPGPSDLHVLKALVALRTHLPPGGPRVVLDLSYPSSARLIPSLAGTLQTEVLSSLDLVGRLFFQCLRHPGISQAYRQLFSDAVGQSILLYACPPGRAGQRLGRLRQLIGGAIVIGVLSQGKASLLAWDELVLSGDELILVASNLQDVEFLDPTQADEPAFGRPSPEHPRPTMRLLVVGFNEGLLALLRECSSQTAEVVAVTLMAGLTPDQKSSLESVIPPQFEFELVQSNLRQAEDLNRLPKCSFDRVLLLAENHPDPAVADAETALRYALLLERESRFVVELHQESNAPLFGPSHDVITTDQMMNHMLAQIALKPDFKDLYQELLSPQGFQLRLLRLSELWQSGPRPVRSSWGSLKERLFEMGWLALGIELAQLTLNPPLNQDFALNSMTRLLVLSPAVRKTD